jgi:hypothetical protein
VANKVIKQETSYIEDLYKANQKKKIEVAKKKRKPQIGFVRPDNVKKPKIEVKTGIIAMLYYYNSDIVILETKD